MSTREEGPGTLRELLEAVEKGMQDPVFRERLLISNLAASQNFVQHLRRQLEEQEEEIEALSRTLADGSDGLLKYEADLDAAQKRIVELEKRVDDFYAGDSGAECQICERLTANGICTECRHGVSPLKKMEARAMKAETGRDAMRETYDSLSESLRAAGQDGLAHVVELTKERDALRSELDAERARFKYASLNDAERDRLAEMRLLVGAFVAAYEMPVTHRDRAVSFINAVEKARALLSHPNPAADSVLVPREVLERLVDKSDHESGCELLDSAIDVPSCDCVVDEARALLEGVGR